MHRRNSRGGQGGMVPPKLRRVGYSSLYPPKIVGTLPECRPPQLLTRNCATANMSMDKHISAVVKLCFLQLRNFHCIRPLISKTAAITLANAFVYSNLEYCNSLFYGLLKYSIHRLQKIQSTTVRIVTRTSCFTHITPSLKSLHWLPVLYRINFKICLTHRSILLGEPYYLRSLLSNWLNFLFLRS